MSAGVMSILTSYDRAPTGPVDTPGRGQDSKGRDRAETIEVAPTDVTIRPSTQPPLAEEPVSAYFA